MFSMKNLARKGLNFHQNIGDDTILMNGLASWAFVKVFVLLMTPHDTTVMHFYRKYWYIS